MNLKCAIVDCPRPATSNRLCVEDTTEFYVSKERERQTYWTQAGELGKANAAFDDFVRRITAERRITSNRLKEAQWEA